MPVYVLIDRKRSCCKIGFSRDMHSVKKRIKSLQTASPFKLDIYAVNETLGVNDEQELHRELAGFATGGGREWFDLSNPQVWDAIQNIRGSSRSHQTILKVEPQRKARLNAEFPCECLGSDCEKECDFSHSISLIGEECQYCVWRKSQACDLTWNEFKDWVLEVVQCQWRPPMFDRLAGYIDISATPVTRSELAEYLLKDKGKALSDFASIASVAVVVDRLTDMVFPESGGDEAYPVAHIAHGDVAIVIPGEFNDFMYEAEDLYQECFWEIDECGCQLFICCINSARHVKYVPISLAYNQFYWVKNMGLA